MTTETPTKRRRAGKVDQPPATAGELADGRSPTDRLPVAATLQEGGAAAEPVEAAAPRLPTVREGIVRGLPEAEYHVGPEVSSTGAKALLDAPARFIEQRDNGRPDKRVFDLGHLIHELILGTGQGIAVVPDEVLAKDGGLSTTAAKAFVAEARRVGKVPIKRADLLNASRARWKVRRHPVAGPLLFGDGESEVSLFWTDEETGVACRGRIDRRSYWFDGRDALVDAKSASEGGANPRRIAKASHDYGQHIQAAMYLDGAVACGLVGPDAVFLHAHVEVASPHIVTVTQLTQDALELGREEYRRALRIYRDCSVAGHWPGYSDAVVSIDLPAYAYRDVDV